MHWRLEAAPTNFFLLLMNFDQQLHFRQTDPHFGDIIVQCLSTVARVVPVTAGGRELVHAAVQFDGCHKDLFEKLLIFSRASSSNIDYACGHSYTLT